MPFVKPGDILAAGQRVGLRRGAFDPGFGIEVVTLSAEGVEVMSAAQGRLDNSRAAMAEEGVAALVDRLANRLGEGAVWRAEVVQSHVPERAERAAPAISPCAIAGWDPDRPRPIRLLAHPGWPPRGGGPEGGGLRAPKQ